MTDIEQADQTDQTDPIEDGEDSGKIEDMDQAEYVVVTGVSTGIGHAVAIDLAEHGYHVFGSVRKPEDAAPLQTELGASFTPLLFDVTDGEAVRRAAEQVAEVAGEIGLAGLVNNAGIAVGGPLLHLPVDELRLQLEVNVVGVLQVTQAFLPLLGAQRDPPFEAGRIVNISSVSGHIAYPFVGPYAASKHALEAMSDSLRRELMLYDIDVILIVSGAAATPIWEKTTSAQAEKYMGTEYAGALQKMLNSTSSLGTEGMAPQRVAFAVREALEVRKPKTRYLLSNSWLMGWMVPRWLPTRMYDRLLAQQLGLIR